MALEGGTALLVRYKGDFDYWKKLHQNKSAYDAEKKRILNDTVHALEELSQSISADFNI